MILLWVLDSRSNARPLQPSLILIGSSSSSSPKISRRLADSATQYWASPTVSPSAGRVRVNLQLKHNPTGEAGSAIQLQPHLLRLAQIGKSSRTATIVPCSREYPTAEPQLTQTEFSKKSSAPQTSHLKARTSYTSAISTETSILDFFASVRITPLTGGTSP